jgi:DNA polymerase
VRLDEDYLRELELWPFFQLRQREAKSIEAAAVPIAATNAIPLAERGTNAPPATTPGATLPPRARAPVPPSAPTLPVSIPQDPARASRIAALGWAELSQEVSACESCVLCKQRKQAVFGVGATDAPWLFVGEGPGADEDQQGEPFVGQAGKLLDAMLTAAGLTRGREVYIANVVKCRPPGNRTPTPDEAAACGPFLDRQIDLIKPRLIVALGKTAVTRLTGSEASMASLRGKVHRYRDIPVVATYHPAYLLRNLPDKLKAWEDLMFAKKLMQN